MYLLTCKIDSHNGINIEDILQSYDPLSLSISNTEITAIFNEKIDVTLPCNTTWQKLSEDDWQVSENVSINGLSIDCPNTVFGNAKHPSTQLCIQMLQNLPPLDQKKIADVGCGSGVLSLLCHSLGARQISGIDIDPDAIKIAQKNAQKNNMSSIHFSAQDALSWEPTEKLDVIIANIPGNFLTPLLPKLPKLLALNGALIISGPNQDNVQSVQDVIRSLKGDVKENTQEDWFGWHITFG